MEQEKMNHLRQAKPITSRRSGSISGNDPKTGFRRATASASSRDKDLIEKGKKDDDLKDKKDDQS